MPLLAMSFFDDPPRDMTLNEGLVLLTAIALIFVVGFVSEAIADYRSRKV